MSRQSNNNEIMKEGGLLIPHEDSNNLFDITDSDDSSSSSNHQLFGQQPFVLELHDLQRDELPDNPLPEVKTRKLLKKKRAKQPGQEQSAASLSSSSDSSIVPPGPGELSKEEFYDAHESYHDFPESRSAVNTIGNLSITAPPEPENQPKALKRVPETTGPTDASTTEPAQEATPTPTPTAITVLCNKTEDTAQSNAATTNTVQDSATASRAESVLCVEKPTQPSNPE